MGEVHTFPAVTGNNNVLLGSASPIQPAKHWSPTFGLYVIMPGQSVRLFHEKNAVDFMARARAMQKPKRGKRKK